MLSVIWGGPLLRILRHFKIGKIIRIEEPDRHLTKMGTPTMGGVMFIVPVALADHSAERRALLGFDVLGRSVLLPLLVMVGLAPAGRDRRLGRHPRASAGAGHARAHQVLVPGRCWQSARLSRCATVFDVPADVSGPA